MISPKQLLAMSFLLLASATASAATTTYTFGSVTKIEWVSSTINLTGVLINDTVPSTVEFPSPNQLCIQYMDTLMKSPGAYILSLTTFFEQYPNGTFQFVTRSCSLEVAP